MFKSLLAIAALVSFVAAAPPQKGAPVFTATREYQTLTDVPPFFITLTTTLTWTQSPSTTFAHPTGTPIAHHH